MSCTYAQIRQYFAGKLGKYLSSTATAGSTQSSLEDTSYPLTSGAAGDKTWQDYWILRPNAAVTTDKTRRVWWYVPSQVGGTLQPDFPWTNSPSGEAYELHGWFDPTISVPFYVNNALKKMMVPREFSFVSPDNTFTRHSLATAAPWLTDPLWVRRVGVLPTGQSRDVYNPYPGFDGSIQGRVTKDGNVVYLECGTFPTTHTIYVEALKPVYFDVNPLGSSTYGAQSGLTAETDTVDVDVEWAGNAALVEAWMNENQMLAQEVQGRVVNSLQGAIAERDRWDPHWNMRIPRQVSNYSRMGHRIGPVI